MAEAVAVLRPRGLPRPPAAALRGAPWRGAGFVAVGFSDVDEEGATRAAAVPIDDGRVVLRGAIVGPVAPGRPPAGLVASLDRRFLVLWSPDDASGVLGHLAGAAWRGWTVDCRRLVGRAAGRLADDAELSIAVAAAAFRLPEPRPCDPLDLALASAELFLIAATRLEAAGAGTVADLLA
ncbi:MAG TPA: hypothetical protein VNO79_13880 [Actinomycetota bacterium]|nr:hypothetical protein [Actinomycetota bacterium]